MKPERAQELLASAGAVLAGHFVGTSGKHLSVYVAKDRGTRLTSVSSELCLGIAEIFADEDIEAVVAPAVGGIALSQWTAYHLSQLRPGRPEVIALYSEHDDKVIAEGGEGGKNLGMIEEINRVLGPGEKLILRGIRFVLKRGFDIDVRGKRVLEVEDILSTGGSARKTAEAIVAAGGELVALGVLANGGNVTPAACGVKRLEALMTVNRQIFTEEECATSGLCAAGVPINTDFGHGRAFLARQR